MKTKSPGNLYAFWRRFRKILGDLGIQECTLVQSTTAGVRANVSYIRIQFKFAGVVKNAKIELMPFYQDTIGIDSKYRDDLVLIIQNTRVDKTLIKEEMRRVIFMWDIGMSAENFFEQCMQRKPNRYVKYVTKTDSNKDRNEHIDFVLFIRDGDDYEFAVNIDCKSSLPGNKLVRLRDDGVYEVDSNPDTILRLKDWRQDVLREIGVFEQRNLGGGKAS